MLLTGFCDFLVTSVILPVIFKCYENVLVIYGIVISFEVRSVSMDVPQCAMMTYWLYFCARVGIHEWMDRWTNDCESYKMFYSVFTQVTNKKYPM